jgi:long-chain acyl-CoA synthetase
MAGLDRLPRNVGVVLEPVLEVDPDREAVVARDRRLSYRALEGAADRAAGALAELGVGRGDVVAVSLPNESDVVVSLHAVLRLGALWLGVNRNLAAPEKLFILDDAGAKILIADDVALAGLQVSDGLITIRSDVSDGEWQARQAAAGPGPPTTVDLDAPAGISYTSGTTGHPKGLVHSHRNLLLPGASIVESRGYGPGLRRGDCAAMTILNLQVTSSLMASQAGGTQVVMDRTDALGIAAWVREERVNSWFGVPTTLHDLAVHPEVEPEDLATLEDVWTGGTYLPAEIRARFESRFGRRISATYGLTEVPTVVTIQARDGSAPEGSSGTPLPHLVVEIRDEAGLTVGPGVAGEVTVRGTDSGEWAGSYTPMLGYRGHSETAASPVRDGVLFTGDIGELDEHGHLVLRDRRSSLILRGGANVYPAEVERVLLGHPGVVGAAVVGVPDGRLGERVAAAVEVAIDAEVDLDGLLARCRSELARYKVPERWEFGHLPRNAMGKVIRAEVAGWFS